MTKRKKPEYRSTNADAPPVEQPTPTQPSTKNAEPLTATDKGKGSAEAPAQVPAASPAEPAPGLELTPQTLVEVINQITKNEQVMMDEIKRLREEVSSMRGGYSKKRIDPKVNPAATQPQETPAIVTQLAPLALAAIQKFLSGPEEKPKSRIADLVEAKLAARLDSMIEKSLQNISDLMDAEVEGRVMVAERKGVPEPK